MDSGLELLLLFHLACTWALVGLIWTIQVVHYPLFERVGPEHFPAYEAAHARRITWVVGPLMLFELASGLALLALWPPALPAWAGWMLVLLLGLIWLHTALVAVPLHARLGRGFDPRAHAWLVRSNWLRTLAWSARGLLLLWLQQNL
ncbi:hypothetical protein DV704_05915 [Meiothermus sp. QL-1]|uniref:hypothetical protein n=1 Tax=Meiothermus sp. QL-1 TaxID=2058095 RepID=UPI000E0B3189|nr:hypothetical protein [Meiothermus sp. QL-1]RDI95806.1 hypothetical protein DV704_05915 [Meiothermus sp. QL-1]